MFSTLLKVSSQVFAIPFTLVSEAFELVSKAVKFVFGDGIVSSLINLVLAVVNTVIHIKGLVFVCGLATAAITVTGFLGSVLAFLACVAIIIAWLYGLGANGMLLNKLFNRTPAYQAA